MGRLVHQTLDEVEAHAPHAGRVEALEFVGGDVAAHGRDAAGQASGVVKCVHQRTVVGPVAGRLDDDVARKP